MRPARLLVGKATAGGQERTSTARPFFESGRCGVLSRLWKNFLASGDGEGGDDHQRGTGPLDWAEPLTDQVAASQSEQRDQGQERCRVGGGDEPEAGQVEPETEPVVQAARHSGQEQRRGAKSRNLPAVGAEEL